MGTNTRKKPEPYGELFVISGPSGVGKTTIRSEILSAFPQVTYSVSYTTRPPRPGEIDGVTYRFITRSEFERKIEQNLWVEWALVYGNYYGTSMEFLDDERSKGNHILLEIDVQGARQIMKKFPEAITIFIMPPSLEILSKRLKGRNTETEKSFRNRLAVAESEIQQRHLFRHVIVNDDLSLAIRKVSDIFAHCCRNTGS